MEDSEVLERVSHAPRGPVERNLPGFGSIMPLNGESVGLAVRAVDQMQMFPNFLLGQG